MVNRFYLKKITSVIDLLSKVLITYVISSLGQAVTLFFTFSCPNLIMSKRFESSASKHNRKNIENHMVKKIRLGLPCMMRQNPGDIFLSCSYFKN